MALTNHERVGKALELLEGELCCRLYTLCERKKRADEALAYNGLVQSWPEIARFAREGSKPLAEQTAPFNERKE